MFQVAIHLHLRILEPRYASINSHIVAVLQNNFFVLLPTLNHNVTVPFDDTERVYIIILVFQSNTDGYDGVIVSLHVLPW